MKKTKSVPLTLSDGSRIAVVGGGPAGSMFTYFALDLAARYGLNIEIDIYEGKDFNTCGPAGCNHCGGIISESLVQMLATEGIVIPQNVIRRGIESYTMHLETGVTKIETPLQEQRIAAVYRGFGPKGGEHSEQSSFDAYLVGLCEQKGASVKYDRVTDLQRIDSGINLFTKNGNSRTYDLVVGSTGLSKSAFKMFKRISPALEPPKTTKTFICEFYMKKEQIDEYFGNSMHVFLLNIAKVKFGALIPKKNFVTLVMLGSDINQEIVESFIQSETVKNCFPPGINLDKIAPCKCFPLINVGANETAFDDRMVMIGDSGTSKLYKNGIGAAYLTAKAAARTVVFNGISKSHFEGEYNKLCKSIEKDNQIGKLIFTVTTLIQRSIFLKKGLQLLVRAEQSKPNAKRRMSSVLWDTFTGSASYRNILSRTMHPHTIFSLIKYLTLGIFIKN